MDIQKQLIKKTITKTFDNVPSTYPKLSAGSINEKDLKVSIFIIIIEKKKLSFKINFRKHADIYPFWVIFDVKLDKGTEIITDRFIFIQNYQTKSPISFESNFTQDDISNGVKITYQLQQIYPYCSTLKNPGNLCYLNSVLQMLFHLRNFRLFIRRLTQPIDYVAKLQKLFYDMSISNNECSTYDLALSFGWPEDIILSTQQDSAEFLNFLLIKIHEYVEPLKNKLKKSNFDKIFMSQFIDEKSGKIRSTYLLSSEKLDGPAYDIIQSYFDFQSKFTKLPEILFIQANGELKSFEKDEKLDLSDLCKDENLKNKNYTLYGLIIRESDEDDRNGHFLSLIRSEIPEVWMYFSDTTFGQYNTRELKMSILQKYQEIAKAKNRKARVHVLMYISNDVADPMVREWPKDSERRNDDKEKEKEKQDDEKEEMIEFRVSSEEDLVDHVKEGNINFDVSKFQSFSLPKKDKISSIYQKVSELFNMSIDSFSLRESKNNCAGAPSYYILENSDSEINFDSEIVRLFLFKNNETRIPLYLLNYKFVLRNFLKHLSNNLEGAHLEKDPKTFTSKSQQLMAPKLISESISKKLDATFLTEEEELKRYNKTNFEYVQTFYLSPNSKLSDIKSALLKKFSKPENSIVRFYINDNVEKNIYLNSFTDVDENSEINRFNSMNCGKFIYFQIFDITQKIDYNLIFTKFLYFNYMKTTSTFKMSYLKLPIVFLMEKFSVPVTFRKLGELNSPSKTILFPIKNDILVMDKLYKFICAVMNEKYDKNNIMKIYLSFREKTVPFSQDIENVGTLKRALKTNLENACIVSKDLHSSFDEKTVTISTEDVEEEEENKNDSTDNDYSRCPYLVQIHYKIFQPKNGKQVFFRVYFSSNSIDVDQLNQIMMPEGTKVSDFIENINNIFHIDKLPIKDQENMKLINEKKKKFGDFYRVLKITNCKISNIIKKDDYQPGNNVSIRFEPIFHDIESDDFEGFVPVYYGAQYNDLNLIIPFGSPFLFPIYKKDLNIRDITDWKASETYQRLLDYIRTVKGEEFEFYVTDYYGIMQDINPYEFDTFLINKNAILDYDILDKKQNDYKYYISVCIINYVTSLKTKSFNAASFLDEKKYFKDGFKIFKLKSNRMNNQ